MPTSHQPNMPHMLTDTHMLMLAPHVVHNTYTSHQHNLHLISDPPDTVELAKRCAR